ncbi:hypothetical protein RN001_015235 [Aquatica leii]|uniref:Uncharacterized protein n=1 Tax=Aquatica leii TaxID=1421715 RepID=A0AAN7P0R4_9COLE|nr:hypothetical protein RN001_015235 [Aquatica leii]
MIFLVAIVLLTAGYLDIRPSIYLPYASECMCKKGADPDKAYGFIYSLKYPNDPCLKCFVRCSSTSIGYFNSFGEPQDEVILRYAPEVPQQVLDTCRNQTKNELDLCEKLFKYSRCFISYFL